MTITFRYPRDKYWQGIERGGGGRRKEELVNRKERINGDDERREDKGCEREKS